MIFTIHQPLLRDASKRDANGFSIALSDIVNRIVELRGTVILVDQVAEPRNVLLVCNRIEDASDFIDKLDAIIYSQ